LLTDNQSAAALSSHDGAKHSRSKHYDVRYHAIREAQASGSIRLMWIPTQEQLADILTKGLERVNFVRLRRQLMGHEATQH